MTIKLKFWGVRGSLPTPGKDYFKYGGNTSCVELSLDDKVLIFDMGSGIKYLGESLISRKIKNFDIFLSHFHYDHTCGLPFFSPAYDESIKFTIRSSLLNSRGNTFNTLMNQMSKPSFPISINEFKANIKFLDFILCKEFFINKNILIQTMPLNHPDGATGYRVNYNNKSICYITDHEHIVGKENKELISFITGSDILIYDSTYTDEEFDRFIGWGHSTWQEGARIASKANVKKYIIYHHNPDSNDRKMNFIHNQIKNYNLDIEIAKEGMQIIL